MYSQLWDVDRSQGMIWGVMIADALGAAYEHSHAHTPFALPDPFIAKSWKYYRMNTPGTIVAPAGMITDDSEMTLATFAAIVMEKKTNDDAGRQKLRDDLEMRYVGWGRTRCPYGNESARKYLYGIRTIQGLHARVDRLREKDANSESNGFLMRASPFALLEPAWDDVSFHSAIITGNYNANCRRMFGEYLTALRGCLARPVGDPHVDPDIFHSRATRAAILARETKGWSECSILSCRDYFEWVRAHAGSPEDTYMAAIKPVIARGGDTDTTACIVGALAGARFGLARMMESPEIAANVELLKKCDMIRTYPKLQRAVDEVPRPLDYRPDWADGYSARANLMRKNQ